LGLFCVLPGRQDICPTVHVQSRTEVTETANEQLLAQVHLAVYHFVAKFVVFFEIVILLFLQISQRLEGRYAAKSFLLHHIYGSSSCSPRLLRNGCFRLSRPPDGISNCNAPVTYPVVPGFCLNGVRCIVGLLARLSEARLYRYLTG